MAIVFQRPKALLDVPTHYCPGCTHGIIHRLVAECIDELGIEGKTVGIAPVGCAVMAYNYFGCDMIELPTDAPRLLQQASSVQSPRMSFSPIRRRRPRRYRYRRNRSLRDPRREHHRYLRQQRYLRHDRRPDGSHLAARTGHSDHALRQRHKDRRLSRQSLRDALHPRRHRLCGARFGHCVKNINRAKKAIKKAFETQIAGKGFSIVEVISACPTNWGLSPVDALGWLRENMLPYYPLGVYKDKTAEEEAK